MKAVVMRKTLLERTVEKFEENGAGSRKLTSLSLALIDKDSFALNVNGIKEIVGKSVFGKRNREKKRSEPVYSHRI